MLLCIVISFIHSFIHSFNKRLLSIYNMPGTGNTKMAKTHFLSPGASNKIKGREMGNVFTVREGHWGSTLYSDGTFLNEVHNQLSLGRVSGRASRGRDVTAGSQSVSFPGDGELKGEQERRHSRQKEPCRMCSGREAGHIG